MITLPPFKSFLASNIPSVYDNTLSYYDELTKLIAYLEQVVVPAVNETSAEVDVIKKGLADLKSYVEHYFDNLDVQEEINNKLDEMAESGELATIIAEFLTMAPVFGYSTISAMANATNLVDGSIARVLGNTSASAGDGAFYKIRTRTEGDTPDGVNLVAVGDSLVAERIIDAPVVALKTDVDLLMGDDTAKIEIKSQYDTTGKFTYTVVKMPRSDYKFTVVPQSEYSSGVYDYVVNNPKTFVTNGQLQSPTIINGVVTVNTVSDPEYWYILGEDSDGVMKYTKDLNRSMNGNALAADGYYNCFGIWSPLVLNSVSYDYSTELNHSDPNYAYITAQKHPRTIFAYDDDNYYIVLIEGRLQRSIGATYNEMISLIHNLDIPYAFNMDGGGSTQGWLSNPTVNIVVSDGSETMSAVSSRKVYSLLKFERR